VGYHPLVISLANTAEPLYLVNRSGNRPSHEGAAGRLDQGIALCLEAGFKKVLLRGTPTSRRRRTWIAGMPIAGTVHLRDRRDAEPR